MRKVARKLFRELGALRDAQVMNEWVKKLACESDVVRTHLQAAFESKEPNLRANALRVAAKFDQKSWKRLERTLSHRSRLVPMASLAADMPRAGALRKTPGSFTLKPAAPKNPNPGTPCASA